MAKLLYFDCFSGASGDMVLGALLDAGLPLEALREALGSLALGEYALSARRVLRAGVSATKFDLVERSGEGERAAAEGAVQARDGDGENTGASDADDEEGHERAHVHADGRSHRHGDGHRHTHAAEGDDDENDWHVHTSSSHRHDHRGHAHRSLREIESLIATSALSPAARDRAVALFRRLAEAEAAIHDMPVERVHLHEVGALDSIVDIVGGVFALEWFGADRIASSPLNVGGGMVTCAHGRFPVPAPATARLLAGVPVYSAGPSVELLTPTGALLVTGYAGAYGPLPAMSIDRIGYGAGERNFPGTPNVLRVLVGTATEAPAAERVTVVECEMDDMNPQLYGVLMDRLLAAGALDVFLTPVQMKKNRPGTLVTVLVSPERRLALSDIIFAETTTLGVRYHDVLRDRLEREERVVQTSWGDVRIKVARRGGQVMNAAPEFDDCVRLAEAGRVAVKVVQAAALQAFLNRADA